VVNYIARIPISERVKNNVDKAYWKELAEIIGVPRWVIDREKIGFVHALSR
jgi:hypothetical protein